jgi:hypothetical protein
MTAGIVSEDRVRTESGAEGPGGACERPKGR